MELKEGKVAIVTGGANGIGAAVVKSLADRGVTVVSFDIDGAANARMENANVIPLLCDCTDYSQIAAAVGAALERFGRVDILVNNVGAFRNSSFVKESYEDAMAGFEEMMASCAGSAYACTQLVAPVMAARGKGAIVNVITNHVHRDVCRVSPGEHAYDAAKYALLSLNMSMAAELHPYGIRVNAVDPAAVDTKMLRDFFSERGLELSAESIGRMTGTASLLESREVAEAVCHLLSWEDPNPVGQNYLLRFTKDCDALKIPPKE